MVDVVMKRDAQGRERPQERDFNEAKRVVRVVPRDENMRRYLKHPSTRVGFLAEGSAEWPNDQFTRRRIKEGDVTIEEAAAPQAEAAPAEGGQKVIEPSGAKSAKARTDKEAPAADASNPDPAKTTAPKTS